MDMQPLCSATLVALAHRCLEEPPSRGLDAEIYCALHGIEDANDLSTPSLVAARQAGEVLIVEHDGATAGRWRQEWIEAPPFSGELRYAALLLPEGVHALSRDPAMVCATALSVLAMTAAPPVPSRPPARRGSAGRVAMETLSTP